MKTRPLRVSQPIVPKIRSENLNVPLVSWTDAKSKKPTAVKGTGDFSLMTRRARNTFNRMFTDAK